MDEALELIRELAGKIGQTVDGLWPHAVRYYALEALAVVLGSFFALIVALGIFYGLRNRPWLRGNQYDRWPSERMIVGFICGIVFFVTLVNFCRQFPIIMEPTGYAVNKILSRGN